MEDVVDRAFDLQLRQGLLKGVNLTHEQIPMFDFQDERELENKKEKIKQYYTNWLQKGSLSETAKAYDSLVKQHAEQRKMIDEIIDFTEKFYDGNHNPLSTKTRLTEIFAKYGYDVK
jgi:hypothetical protein